MSSGAVVVALNSQDWILIWKTVTLIAATPAVRRFGDAFLLCQSDARPNQNTAYDFCCYLFRENKKHIEPRKPIRIQLSAWLSLPPHRFVEDSDCATRCTHEKQMQPAEGNKNKAQNLTRWWWWAMKQFFHCLQTFQLNSLCIFPVIQISFNLSKSCWNIFRFQRNRSDLIFDFHVRLCDRDSVWLHARMESRFVLIGLQSLLSKYANVFS